MKSFAIWTIAPMLIVLAASAGNAAGHKSTAVPTVSESVLWSFGATDDGSQPLSGLIADKWGNLYGTTYGGGAIGSGTVFELSPPSRGQKQWTEHVLWSFTESDDGNQPVAGLIADN